MKGLINSNFEPIVKIGLSMNGKLCQFEAIIDTGFNGFISIPHKIIEKASWQFIGYESYELASGEIIRDKVFLGDIIFCGKKQFTYILANKTEEVLIGTKLFANKILTINFKTNKLDVREG